MCKALFPYLDSSWEMWWTVDGKTLDKLPDHHRFNRTIRWKHFSHSGSNMAESLRLEVDIDSIRSGSGMSEAQLSAGLL